MEEISAEIFDVAIIGAGPAGSTAAIYLSRKGIKTCLIEKKKFPRETLCGEFLSKEVAHAISELGLTEKFYLLNPNPINAVVFSYKNEKPVRSLLGFTGYGLTRGKFDNLLRKEAERSGTNIFQPFEVNAIERLKGSYKLSCISKEASGGRPVAINARRILCAYGKQNHLDRSLGRSFVNDKSHLNGIKIHLPSKYLNEFNCDEIHLYSSGSVYCGVNAVGEDTATVCFLEHRTPGGHKFSGLRELMETNTSFRHLFDPSIINIIDKFPYYGVGNIFFGKRALVVDGMIMIGDAAHVIAPLAGDGIAMAMQSAKIISDIIITNRENLHSKSVEVQYNEKWNKNFKRRIFTAGVAQKFLLTSSYNRYIPIIEMMFPSILGKLIKLTRSK